ncbi:porin [Enterovibrio sp. ZSDZ35]|uniref:Porin n=1 Tax=Enterovibrio qingdaonensis TaxID=2899818 RepID=A0ABT5QH33_9GAMM|nr:porin [Enterovibrio sp. ZSDZ35]MDD1780278.1 porin [Enterovibrio sp. ZSDZ35]
MNKYTKGMLTLSALLAASGSHAAVTLYDDGTSSVSTDLLINVFYTQSSNDRLADSNDPNSEMVSRDQSRVRIGFLPNYIGFNFNTEANGLKIGARSSFWVTLNDTDLNRSAEGLGTRSGIDVRQFYATIDADWGQILLGKDFGLFSRSNILTDELLLGHGQTSDFYGLIDGGNVSFGNIGSGYTYPFPKAQITYRTPDLSGFQVAVGVMDPNKKSKTSSEDNPRFESEISYTNKFNDVGLKAYLNGVTQSSKDTAGETSSNGLGGGIRVDVAGFALNASGFETKGLGDVAGLDQVITSENTKSKGYLMQGSYSFGQERLVLSYGNTKVKKSGVQTLEYDNAAFAWFHTVNDNLTLVGEYNRTEVNEGKTEENDTFAVGAVVTF